MSKPSVPCLFALAVSSLAFSAPAWAAKYTVDPAGGTGVYKTVNSLLKGVSLQPGDLVEIRSGTYLESVDLSGVAGSAAQPVVFRGVGDAAPVWDGGGTCAGTVGAQGRALWQLESSVHDVVLENLVWTNSRCASTENAAGIRLVGAKNVTLRGCRAHHNQNGVFASAGSANVRIDRCEVDHNGNNGTEQEHGFYVEIDGVTVEHCYIHDNAAGSNYKSRSRNDVFRYNWVENAGDFEIDLVESSFESQDAFLYGNVIIQADGSNNWNGQYEYPLNTGKIVKFGGDGGGARKGTLYFANNTVIGGFPQASLFQHESPVVAVNNVYLAKSGWSGSVAQSASPSVTGSNNWFLSAAALGGLGLTGTVLGADPGFVAAAGRDYHLRSTSSLRNAGTNALPASIQLVEEPVAAPNGQPARAGDAVLDIGAYEFVAGCTSPSDCSSPPPCRVAAGATCSAGACVYPAASAGTGCDDGDRCTGADHCDGAGNCVSGTSSCADAGSPDGGEPPGPDASSQPGADASTSADSGCVASPCRTLDGCREGTVSCRTGQCEQLSELSDGTACAGGVCREGACRPCTQGASCTSVDGCRAGSIECASGQPACAHLADRPDGTACAGGTCRAGACTQCQAGLACLSLDGCETGSIDCAGASATCSNWVARADGTACSGGACHAGVCNACAAGAACSLPEECKLGAVECSTGEPVCQAQGNRADGTACASGTCVAGACAPRASADAGVAAQADAGSASPVIGCSTAPGLSGGAAWLMLSLLVGLARLRRDAASPAGRHPDRGPAA